MQIGDLDDAMEVVCNLRKQLENKDAEIAELKRELEACISLEDYHIVEQDRDELQGVFDLQYKANMRGIEAWQNVTGKTLIWPDQGNLIEWLLTERDTLQSKLEEIESKSDDEAVFGDHNLIPHYQAKLDKLTNAAKRCRSYVLTVMTQLGDTEMGEDYGPYKEVKNDFYALMDALETSKG